MLHVKIDLLNYKCVKTKKQRFCQKTVNMRHNLVVYSVYSVVCDSGSPLTSVLFYNLMLNYL